MEDWLTLLPSTQVSALGGRKGFLRVGVGRFLSGELEVLVPLSLELRCEDTTIFTPVRETLPEAEHWAQVNVAATSEFGELAPNTAVTLRAAPGGAERARLRAQPHGHVVRIVERRGDWWRIVWSHWDGAFVRGWVPANVVVAGKLGGLSAVFGIGGLLGAGPPPPSPVRSCAQALPLRVRRGADVRDVGTVARPAGFRVLGPAAGGHVPVRIDGPVQLEPAVGVELLLPEAAARCPLVGSPEN